MIDSKIKDAKTLYMNTGRLNQNIVSKEIAISWYKCKLQNMKTSDSIKQCKHITNNHFDAKFLDYVEAIVSEMYQYVLTNSNFQVCKSRLIDKNFMSLNSIDDLLIGTNGGYNSAKNHSLQIVSKEEHFLEIFVEYHTIGIPIEYEEKKLGTLMIISEHLPSEYELNGIKEKLLRYYNKEQFSVLSSEVNLIEKELIDLDNLFAFPSHYQDYFAKQVESVANFVLPTLICGEEGSGKTTLAWYLGMKLSIPFYINLGDTDSTLQSILIEQALSQNSTVIVEGIEFATKQTLILLTVYIDSKTDNKIKPELSKYKCKRLILTIVNRSKSDLNISIDNKLIETIIEKLKLSTIQLKNLEDFSENKDEIYDKIYKRYYSDRLSKNNYTKKDNRVKMSYKELVSRIKNAKFNQTQLNSLEEQEKAYILGVYDRMNQNIIMTANILKISRSTLYRKLEKYQNETLSTDS